MFACPVVLDMKGAGTVATFATDCQFRDSDPLPRPLLHTPRVADEAVRQHRPLKAMVNRPIVPRRHPPTLFLGVPGEGGLPQEPVRLNEIGAGETSGADEEADGEVEASEFPALDGAQDFLVAELAALPINAVGAPGGFVLEGAIGGLRLRVHLGKGAAVGGVQIRMVVGGMAPLAGVDPDVTGLGPRVAVRALGEAREGEDLGRRGG
jgi:hypothetical protein